MSIESDSLVNDASRQGRVQRPGEIRGAEGVCEVSVCRAEEAGFVRSVLQELRCPLNVISGFTELLDDERTGSLNDSQRRCVEQIERSTRDLVLVLDELLDYSRLQDNHFPMAWEAFELAPIVDGCLKSVEALARKRMVHMERVGSGATRSDARALRQLVGTVLKNSLQFTPPGGRIRVRIEPTDDAEMLISIEDSGEAIAESCTPYREECFGPTTRVTGQSSRVGHSRQMSLGMRLAQALALRCGTSFSAAGRKGGGTEVSFTLRSAAASGGQAESAPQRACAVAGGGG